MCVCGPQTPHRRPRLPNTLCAESCFGAETGRDRSRAITGDDVLNAQSNSSCAAKPTWTSSPTSCRRSCSGSSTAAEGIEREYGLGRIDRVIIWRQRFAYWSGTDSALVKFMNFPDEIRRARRRSTTPSAPRVAASSSPPWTRRERIVARLIDSRQIGHVKRKLPVAVTAPPEYVQPRDSSAAPRKHGQNRQAHGSESVCAVLGRLLGLRVSRIGSA